MGLRRQILISLVVLVGGLCLWLFLSPAAPAMLNRMGVPAGVIAALPKGGEGKPSQGGDQRAAQGGGQGGQAGGQGQGGGQRGPGAPFVLTVAVTEDKINDRLSAIGTGEAIQSVAVTPQVAGPIAEVLVKSGDSVEKGRLLARLDNAEQIIARDQAKVALRSATEKANAYGNMTSSMARLDVFNAKIAVETAELALETAELNLKRRDIVAPISGVTGIVTINPGDNVTTQTVIATVDDRSELLVDYWVPERFSNVLAIGQPVEASPVAQPGKVFPGEVAAIDNRIDQASRTLRVRARIPNKDDVLRAGMAFSVGMTFAGEAYPAVDPLSVQWDSNGSYIWRVTKDMKTEKVRVRIVQRNPDSVLVEADLKIGDLVVTEGLQRVREGGEVRLPGRETKTEGGTDRLAVKQ